MGLGCMTAQNQCRGKSKEGLRKGIVMQGYPENDQNIRSSEVIC